MLVILLVAAAWICYQAYLKAGGGVAGEQAASETSWGLVKLLWLGLACLLVYSCWSAALR